MNRTESAEATIEGESMVPYPDSEVGSSPRSGKPPSVSEDSISGAMWDEANFTRVKLMCSYGGRILPRPHDNQLRYVGGDSKIVVVPRNATFSDLIKKLSKMFGASVAVKYQLPCEDLDALISVTSDEDLEIMMEENDRLQQQGPRSLGSGTSSSMSATSTRLRLFLFPTKMERSQTANLSEMYYNMQNREKLFVDILNGVAQTPRVRSETSSISENPDFLFGLDAMEEWAAAASYGAGSVPASSAAGMTSTGSFLTSPDKPPEPIQHGLTTVPFTRLGSLLARAGGEAFSAPEPPLGPAAAASKELTKNLVPPSSEMDSSKPVKESDSESCQSIRLEPQDDRPNLLAGLVADTHHSGMPGTMTNGNKLEVGARSEHLLPSELLVNENPSKGLTTSKQAITTMPIYDEEDQSVVLPSVLYVDNVRTVKREEKKDAILQETLVQKLKANAELDDGAPPIETESSAPSAICFVTSNALPEVIQVSSPVYHQPVSSALMSAGPQLKVASKVAIPLEQQVKPRSNAEIPVTGNVIPSAGMLPKFNNLPHIYQQQVLQQVSMEPDTGTYATQFPGAQLRMVPAMQPNSASGGTVSNVGGIAPSVHVGAIRPAHAGGQQTVVAPSNVIVGGPPQPISTVVTHLQLPRVITNHPQAVDHGIKAQQGTKDPTYHFQKAASPVPVVTGLTEAASHRFSPPTLPQVVPPVSSRFRVHPALQQATATTAVLPNMGGRAVTPLPAQYYYMMDHTQQPMSNVYLTPNAAGMVVPPTQTLVAGANPFVDDLHPLLTSADIPTGGSNPRKLQ